MTKRNRQPVTVFDYLRDSVKDCYLYGRKGNHVEASAHWFQYEKDMDNAKGLAIYRFLRGIR